MTETAVLEKKVEVLQNTPNTRTNRAIHPVNVTSGLISGSINGLYTAIFPYNGYRELSNVLCNDELMGKSPMTSFFHGTSQILVSGAVVLGLYELAHHNNVSDSQFLGTLAITTLVGYIAAKSYDFIKKK